MATYTPVIPWLAVGLLLLFTMGGTAYVMFYLISLLFMAYRFHIHCAYLALLHNGPHPLSTAAKNWTQPSAKTIQQAHRSHGDIQRIIFAMLTTGILVGITASFPSLAKGFQDIVDRQAACTSPNVINPKIYRDMKIEPPEDFCPPLPFRPIDLMLPKSPKAWTSMALTILAAFFIGFFDVWADTTQSPQRRLFATAWRRRSFIVFLGFAILAIGQYAGLFDKLEELIVYGIGILLLYILIKRTW